MVETNVFGDTLAETESITNIFGDPVATTPSFEKKKKEEDEDRAGYVTSTIAGLGSGVVKAVEGFTTLGTTLIDLGAGTELTKKVEKAFDDNPIIAKMEDLADDRWTGKMTEILVQLGVPGGVALKGAGVLLKAKHLGTLGRVAKRMPKLTKMAAVGGAELAAKTEDLSTLGDMMDVGLTEQRRNQGETGRLDALRKLENRFKFGLEGALGFGLFDNVFLPVIKKSVQVGVPTLKGMITGAGRGPNRTTKMIPDGKGGFRPEVLQLEEGFQFSRNNILRAFDKFALAPLRARGWQTQEMFDASRRMIGAQKEGMEQARGIVNDLEKAVQDFIQPAGGGLINKLDDVGLKKREEIMEAIYDYLTAPKNMKASLKDRIPSAAWESMEKMRSHIDNLSTLLKENPLAAGHSDAFVRTVGQNLGEYMSRSYRAFGKSTKKDWTNTLYNSDKGKQILEKTRVYLAGKNPGLWGDVVDGKFVPKSGNHAEAMEEQIRLILESGKLKHLGDHLVKLKSVDNAVFTAREKVPKQIRELLGEIKDPSIQLIDTTTKINNFLTSSKYFQRLADTGIDRYFFRNATPTEGGLNFTTKIETDLWNPLNGLYTTPDIASSIHRVANVAQKEGMGTALYNGIVLAPKALIQESKTTLSPITHARNIISAISFSGMNGNLFNPSQFIKDFRRSWQISKSLTKSQLESQAGRRLFQDDAAYQGFLKEYNEMQRLGIINTNARMGDLKMMLDDMSVGLENLDQTGQMYNLLRRIGQKSGITRLREGARTLYQVEDDFYKIQNYFAEQGKYSRVWDKLYEADPNAFVRKYGELARSKYGITDLFNKQNYKQFVKETAAETVRNNIPNYDFVSPLVKFARKMPFGNFISFPAEILRTGVNTIKQGVREWNDPLTKGIGTQRLLGVGIFGLGLGKGVEEAAQLISGTSNKTVNAIKQFLPEWSKNSTLIPIKQDGQLYFIDFSHTNAYDFLTRPLRAAWNGMAEGIENEEGVLRSIDNAAIEGSKEFFQPFLEESIITKFYGDMFLRGGMTRDGKQLWNPEEPFGNKLYKGMTEAVKAFKPGSIDQLYRLYLSGTGQPDKYTRGYKFFNEAFGVLGFRIQNPFIEQGVNFKIAENQKAQRAAKGIWTKAAYDGTSTSEDLAKAYTNANEAKMRNDKELFKQVEAAKQLGMSEREIRKILRKRYPKSEAGKLIRNQFTPLKISSFEKKKIKENAEIRNVPDPYRTLRSLFNGIYRNFRGQNLFDNPEGLLEGSLDILEDRTPNVVYPKHQDAYMAGEREVITPPIENVPNIFGDMPLNTSSLQTGAGTLDQAAKAALVKPGDIDITEAIVQRRT